MIMMIGILVLFENFLRFHLQDKHNASKNSNMSWKEHTQSNTKIGKTAE